jgi:peptide/nickel transport system permease protein
MQYIAKRLLFLFPVMLGVLVVTFFIARILPGDPLFLMIGKEIDQALIDRVRAEMGLDKPVVTQFYIYVRGVLSGDLGMAWHTGNPVTYDMKFRFPATFELTTLGLLVSVAFSIPFGVIAAVRRDGILDHMCRGVSLVGVSLPSFWLGLVLIYFLFYQLHIFPPPLGRGPIGFALPRITGLYLVDSLLTGNIGAFFTSLRYLTLPVVTLALVNMAPLTRLTRSSMIEVLGADYVRSARAAGISERIVTYRLALKNALLAPVTMIGLMYGQLLAGTVIAETIFSWPGLGLWAVNAAASNDYAPIQAFALLAAVLRVIVFLIVDLVYFAIDPRIRY